MPKTRSRGSIALDNPVAPCSPPDVCILSFSRSDISAEENTTVTEAYRGIGCRVSNIDLNSTSFRTRLEAFLKAEGSRIIHIYAHGQKAPDGLVLWSHRAGRNNASKPWSEVQAIVQDTKCPVLVILDCCYAGLAELNSSNDFAKELILAATWNDGTHDKLAKSLGRALIEWNKKSSTKTAHSLHSYLEKDLKERRNEQLRENTKVLDNLKEEKARLKEHPDHSRVVQKEMKVVKSKMKLAKEEKSRIEAEFPQPFYKKGVSRTVHWHALRLENP